MLDVCRHYMPVNEIRRLLDAAQILGLNRFHWHLSDDQGWRIEIRKYPKLTEVGSVRGDSYFGGTPEKERNCGYYTQQEVRDIVVYAGSLGIEIIPEIEIPGHASAMLAALPQCGCRAVDAAGNVVERPYRYEVLRAAGIYPNLVCAGREEPMQIYRDILDEITELFPFPMVHIGGDEAPKLRWRRCPDCQRRMREQGIESEDALQRQLVLDIGEYLAQKGRRTIVWNDVLAGGLLPGHFVVQQWLGDAPLARAFMEAGGQVICSDTRHYYFDYPYGVTDAHAVYDHPMIPEYARKGELLGQRFDPDHIPDTLGAWDDRQLDGNYARVAQTIRVEDAIGRYDGPVLVVHGDQDEAVPVEYGIRAAELYKNAKLVLIEGDDHCYNAHLEQVTDAVKAWMLERLNQPCA